MAMMRWCLAVVASSLLLSGCTVLLDADEDSDGSPDRLDCDDNDPATYPDAPEQCDGRDNDCDGTIDELSTTPAPAWYVDVDQDGHGDGGQVVHGCAQPAGYVGTGDDCDDMDPAVAPGAAERCNAVDDDCDGEIDEAGGEGQPQWYADVDLDGFGDGEVSTRACEPPPGYTERGSDCDDADGLVHPGAADGCDDVDQDCDGVAGEGEDLDGDGFSSCDAGDGAVDCDDGEVTVYPGATETCDNLDNDCDGEWDEEVPEALLRFYFRDADYDGAGAAGDWVRACWRPEGYAVPPDDCDDADYAVHPMRQDFGGGVPDLDCDGRDIHGQTVYYVDRDGDGFGSRYFGTFPSYPVITTPREGFVRRRGDCDDENAAIRPGANDPPDDGIDQDCGGHPGPDVHVRLSASSRTSIAEALAAAAPGSVIWVGPGTYHEDLSFAGKAVQLISTDWAEETLLDSRNGVRFDQDEYEATLLDGFTITYTGTEPQTRGGVVVVGSSPTLTNLIIRGNRAEGPGGGMFLSDAVVHPANCHIIGNHAPDGGGIFVEASEVGLYNVTLEENVADGDGGAIHAAEGSVGCQGCRLLSNRADRGGGVFVSREQLASLHISIVAGNRAREGGGIWMDNGRLWLQASTLAGNVAELGGGILIRGDGGPWTSTPGISYTILAHNTGYNLYLDGVEEPAAGEESVWIDHSVLYNPRFTMDDFNHNLPSLDESNVIVDPGFARWSNDGDVSNDDFHLLPTSPLRTAPHLGDTAGVYSQTEDYGTDTDNDGLYDAWEVRYGFALIESTTKDSELDPDGDGLTNLEELEAGTDPTLADTDGDGADDATELAAGIDPNDWYRQPGQSGAAIAKVPGDFPTIQAAIDAVQLTGAISLDVGTYRENLRIEGKMVSLQGSAGDGPETEYLVGNGEGPVVDGLWAWLELGYFQISGGAADHGGGVSMIGGQLGLSGMTVSGNTARVAGGGLYLRDVTQARLEVCRVEGNRAQGIEDARGGGIAAERSSIQLVDCDLTGNQAVGASSTGGGIALHDSTGVILQTWIEDNTAGAPEAGLCEAAGGGIYARESQLTLDTILLAGNGVLNGGGGGIALVEGEATMTDAVIEQGFATGSGPACGLGGGLLAYGPVSLTNVGFSSNLAGQAGGGIYVGSSSSSLTNTTLVDNHAGSGGGVYVAAGAEAVSILNAILAYNDGYNLYVAPDDSAPDVEVRYSALYHPGPFNHNLSGLDGTNQSVEPGFQSYDGGVPSDYRLAVSSPLLDTGSPDLTDWDDSRSDPGLYGGRGAGMDLDDDTYLDYFWPGTPADAPEVNPFSRFDCDDRDAAVTACL